MSQGDDFMSIKRAFLAGNLDFILNDIDKEKNLYKFNSYLLFVIINCIQRGTVDINILIRNKEKILNKICYDFNLYDCLSLLCLLKIDCTKEEAKKIYCQTIKQIFSKEAILFLNSLCLKFGKMDIFEESIIYNEIFNSLINIEDNNKISKILYNLFLLVDFQTILKERYHVVALMIDKYQKFNPRVISDNLFLGSSIIGCLIKGQNQYIAQSYFDLLTGNKKNKDASISMIGGGSTCLVYKIGNNVLKLGETRNSKTIFIDFRILASQIRKLIIENDKELFYVEVMKYIKTGDITIEECEELKNDLLSRGIIWEDAKPENCGLLDNDDKNICDLPVDYVNVAGKTDDIDAKEKFMKRKRKVVVLDNDNMRRNPKSLWK